MVTQEKREGESFDSVLRKFKRRVKNEGTLQEYRAREFYEKPSDEKKRKNKAAKRRNYRTQREDD